MSLPHYPLTASLIVPMFNESKYIGKLLDSAYQSFYKIDEIILCDNNSTDNTIEIVKRFMQKLPLKILHQKEKGIIPTVELAWRNASGDIILKVDADSVLPKQWVDHTLKHFHEDPLLAGCTGPLIGSDGHRLDQLLMTYGSSIGGYLLSVLQRYPLLLGPNSAFKKSALMKVNGYISDKPELDDQLISRKLYVARLKTKWFTDMKMYHSTRRYQNTPIEYAKCILSFFDKNFYSEKTA